VEITGIWAKRTNGKEGRQEKQIKNNRLTKEEDKQEENRQN
jgi:hypothetical protein